MDSRWSCSGPLSESKLWASEHKYIFKLGLIYIMQENYCAVINTLVLSVQLICACRLKIQLCLMYVKRTTRLWTHPSFTHAAAAAAAVEPRFISRILTFSGDASRYKISMCGMRFVSRSSCRNYTVFNFICGLTVKFIIITLI